MCIGFPEAVEQMVVLRRDEVREDSLWYWCGGEEVGGQEKQWVFLPGCLMAKSGGAEGNPAQASRGLAGVSSGCGGGGQVVARGAGAVTGGFSGRRW